MYRCIKDCGVSGDLIMGGIYDIDRVVKREDVFSLYGYKLGVRELISYRVCGSYYGCNISSFRTYYWTDDFFSEMFVSIEDYRDLQIDMIML